MKKFILISFLFLFLFLFIILCNRYYNHNAYGRLSSTKSPSVKILMHIADEFFNEIDFVKSFKQVALSDADYTELLLSGDDLKSLQKTIKKSQEEGFINDQHNKWRKAKILVNGEKQKIKYKLHGTSITPARTGRTLMDRLKTRLHLQDNAFPPISRGAFSIKIKHKKSSKYKNLMRRYNLITSYDEIELHTISINKIAADFGLIAPHGKMTILKINGADIGLYMMVENHRKEWFEKHHKLTNYTIIKSNADWDQKYGSHASDTDLFIQNKEVSDKSSYDDIALGALDSLFRAIKNHNIDEVKKLIDLDYMAKFMALLTITNNSHPILGDNLRYIYDHAIGKFKFLFRVEDRVFANTSRIAGFDASLFHGADKNVDTHKLFKMLLADMSFLSKRNKELYVIVNNLDHYLNIMNDVVDENMNIILSSKIPTRPILYKIKRFSKIFTANIQKAKNYLNYNKVYVTRYSGGENNKSRLSIINDSYSSIMLSEIIRSTKLKDIFNKETKRILIDPPNLNSDLNMNHKEQMVYLNTENIYKLKFKNTISGSDIDEHNIYINEAREFSPVKYRDALNSLAKNNIIFKINHKNKLINVKKGFYIVASDIIIPEYYDLNLEPGVTFKLKEKVSFLVQGDLTAVGNKNSHINISRFNKEKPFGVFSVIGKGLENSKVNISYLDVSGGSEALINGAYFSGQISFHNVDLLISNSSFSNSSSDDGINIKNSSVNITDSKFLNNIGDQIDLDYCTGYVADNIFIFENINRYVQNPSISTDGLDVSGSVLTVKNNMFKNFNDKGISVGELSNLYIKDNVLINNSLGIAVKDGSKIFSENNKFTNNKVDIISYVKKKFYSEPTIYTNNSNNNITIKDGALVVMKPVDMNQRFRSVSQ